MKKIFSILGSFLAAIGLTFTGSKLTTVNATDDHTVVKVEGQEATCSQDGYLPYYQCSDCNKLFTSSACVNEITDLDAYKTGEGKIPAGKYVEEIVITPSDITATIPNQQFGDVKGFKFGIMGYFNNKSSISSDGEFITFDVRTEEGGTRMQFYMADDNVNFYAIEMKLEDGYTNTTANAFANGWTFNAENNLYSWRVDVSNAMGSKDNGFYSDRNTNFNFKTKEIRVLTVRNHTHSATIDYDDATKQINSVVKCNNCGETVSNCSDYKWYHKLSTTRKLPWEEFSSKIASSNVPVTYDEDWKAAFADPGTGELEISFTDIGAEVGDTIRFAGEDQYWDTARTQVVSGGTGVANEYDYFVTLTSKEFTVKLRGDYEYGNDIWFNVYIITAADQIITTDKAVLKTDITYGANYVLVATFNGEEIVSNWEVPEKDPNVPEGTSENPSEPTKPDLDVIVTDKNGDALPVDIEVVVEISVSSVLKESLVKNDFTVDYKTLTKKREKVAAVYDVKLYREIGGVRTQIQPSDIAPGTVLLIKMELPKDLKVKKITKFLHVHDDGSYDVITDYRIENGFMYFEIDSLSEFAIIVDESVCAAHWLILFFIILYAVAAFAILIFANDRVKEDKDDNNKEEKENNEENTSEAKVANEEQAKEEKPEEKKEKDKKNKLTGADLAFIIAGGVFLLLLVLSILISRCWFCVVLDVLGFLLLALVTACWFLRKPLVEKMRKDGKESKVEKFLNAAPLSASMAVAAPVENKELSKETIAEYLTKKENIIVNRRKNTAGNSVLPLADTHYFTYKDAKGKQAKECFIYVYELKDNKKLIILKTDEDTLANLKAKHSSIELSRFPVGGKWYSMPLDDSYTFAEIADIIDVVLANLAEAHKVVTTEETAA